MELWIRSQDKRTLVNTRRIDVDDNKIIIWDEGKYASDVFMGEYATKERALEVLDEIQSLIDFMICKEVFTYDSEEFMQLTYKQIQHIKENGCVYEMPKE